MMDATAAKQFSDVSNVIESVVSMLMPDGILRNNLIQSIQMGLLSSPELVKKIDGVLSQYGR